MEEACGLRSCIYKSCGRSGALRDHFTISIRCRSILNLLTFLQKQTSLLPWQFEWKEPAHKAKISAGEFTYSVDGHTFRDSSSMKISYNHSGPLTCYAEPWSIQTPRFISPPSTLISLTPPWTSLHKSDLLITM